MQRINRSCLVLMLTDDTALFCYQKKVLQTFRAMLLALLHLDEFFPDPACGVYQLVKPLELHRILGLLIIRLFTGLVVERQEGNDELRDR